MPKAVEDHLKAAAKKKGFTGERADRYVYGALENMKKRKKGITTRDAAKALANRKG